MDYFMEYYIGRFKIRRTIIKSICGFKASSNPNDITMEMNHQNIRSRPYHWWTFYIAVGTNI